MTNLFVADYSRAGLQARFTHLWQRCLLSGVDADSVSAWQQLSQHYSEKHRLYHTLEHLSFCMREFDTARHLMDTADTVEMAIWYHDINHNPQTMDNEYQSRLLFESIAQDIFDQEFSHTVGNLIMATTHNQTPETRDEYYICDIDLSSMGASWEKFIQDSNALKAESDTATERYSMGKLKFFNALLERPRIFYTDFFHSLYEATARKNIQRYISMLNQKG